MVSALVGVTCEQLVAQPLVAVLFNYPLAWRRYPAVLQAKQTEPQKKKASDEVYPPISHADFVYALSEIDSFIDVTEQDLVHIYELATHRRVHRTTG